MGIEQLGKGKQIKMGLRYLCGGWTAYHLYQKMDEDLKMRVRGDYRAYCGSEDVTRLGMIYCLDYKDTFRDVYAFRQKFLKGYGLEKRIFHSTFPCHPGILIGEGDIGPGFRVYHNYCTVGFEKVGKNFELFQGVTSGNRGKPGLPIIGDDVLVGANAVLLGHIHIGNRVKIGAGAVVTTDVPDDCVVVGNPAQILPPREKRKDTAEGN